MYYQRDEWSSDQPTAELDGEATVSVGEEIDGKVVWYLVPHTCMRTRDSYGGW